MNVQQIQAVQTRLQEVLRFADAQGDSGRKTALKVQMALDECDTCIRQHSSRNTYLLELMLKDCVIVSLMKADLSRAVMCGRSMVFGINRPARETAEAAMEKFGEDIMTI